MAIIIDDIGYRHTDASVLSLPTNITLSVLPFTPLGKELAQKGHAKGHEIMLHLPMQALNSKALGEGGLTNQMSEQQTKQHVLKAISAIPFAKGANNHMGSLLTQLEDPMLWVMQSLKQQDLYFVDSMTTRFTKAREQASLVGVPTMKREIFLDNDLHPKALEKQFKRMIAEAKTQGYIVAIAHPYPETLAFLQQNLPRLNSAGIRLVPTSALIPLEMAKQGASATVRLK